MKPGNPPIYAPGPELRTVLTPDGKVLAAPENWSHLPPGDPGLTRRVKLAGESWQIQQKRGRKIFKLGIYAPTETIERIRAELAAERSTETYAKRLAAGARRRDKQQAEYVEDFEQAVIQFLNFHPTHQAIAKKMAAAIAQHATPVGSGTVARTKLIPIEQRAEAAVIAWMRHQTTGYDSMYIQRIRGERREVRRELAQRSRALLERYRHDGPISESCPLYKALSGVYEPEEKTIDFDEFE